MSAPFEQPAQFSIPCVAFPPLWWWAEALSRQGSAIPLYSGVLSSNVVPNRYAIATANGVQTLSIPLAGGRRQRIPLAEIRIEYRHDWQRQHWGALYSAYGRAPFFEHYAGGLQLLVHTRHENLESLCRSAIEWLSHEMQTGLRFEISDDAFASSAASAHRELPHYHQVFEERWGFQPGLSAIDLLMNEGPGAGRFLRAGLF